MDTNQILTWCDEIIARAYSIKAEVGAEPEPEPPPDVTVIEDGGDLQAAMDAGGVIRLAEGASVTKADGYKFSRDDTAVRGTRDNHVSSSQNQASAFVVPVNFHGATLEGLAIAAPNAEVAVLLGRNDSGQVNLSQAPTDLTLIGLQIHGHRGKRAIECNGSGVTIRDCDIRDLYDPEKADSQAVWFGNCPGPGTISGGHYEAAAENVMIGGDTMKIPNCRPTGFLIENAEFTKPLDWKGNTAIPVKNLIELKDGHDVLIRNCRLWNSWRSAQDGTCFMFTPKNGGSLRDVRVENCTVSDVGSIVNITGHDFTAVNAADLPRSQVEIHGGSYTTNKVAMGGTGRFCLITEGPERVVFSGLTVQHEGSAFIEYGDKDPCDVLHVLNCSWNYGSYGIRIGGYNHGDNALGIIKDLKVVGCTITGAHSQFKSRYPNNTYVDLMTAAQERAVDDKHALKTVERDLRDELQRQRSFT